MRHSIDDYLNAARARLSLDSDRALDRALEFRSTSVSFYRRKKALPSETVMINLAILAGVDPALALIDLAMWRAEARQDGHALTVWQRLHDMVSETMV